MINPPKILITNDDGIESEGLSALSNAMKDIGNVTILAPEAQRSGSSHSITLNRPLRLTRVGPDIFSSDGTPTDCIILALKKVLSSPPDLLVSGINKGPNMGDDITYSGTVSAAIEGTLKGIPSFAVSLSSNSDYQFETAAFFARQLALQILCDGLPPYTFLNVNVPNLSLNEVRSVRITRQGVRIYHDTIQEIRDENGGTTYLFKMDDPGYREESGTDFEAIENGYVSITPMCLDLTDHGKLESLKPWEDLLIANSR